jgi:glycosyltransferase involved in cell wall biosynthesis
MTRHHDVLLITGEREPMASGARHFPTELLNLDIWKGTSGPPEQELEEFFVGILSSADVVHGHNLHHFFPQPAHVLDRLRHRVGFRLHHTFHETWPDLLAGNPLYAAWDGAYAISHHVQTECERRLGFRPELLLNAVDTEIFQPVRVQSNGGVVVFLHPARLLPWKGVDVTVRAAAMIRDRGVPFKLILTDTKRIADWDDELVAYRDRLIRLVSDTGLTADVEFVSADYPDMPNLYAKADVVVYPTVGEEPFGLVPIEAMACGRPVVATNSGGLVESVVDGATGYVVERGSVAALADAMEALATSPDLRRQMGVAGRQHVLAHFSLDQYVDKLVARYNTSF